MGRAIVRDPKVFLMDEPLSNLDAKLRVQMRTEVARLQSDLETTMIYVTHDQTEAMTLGDRVAVMRTGELQQVGSPDDLYTRPKNLFVAGFIGSPAMNFMPAEIVDGKIKLPIGEVDPAQVEGLDSVPSGKVVAGIRPENFEDAEIVQDSVKGERGLTFEAEIDLVESLGSDLYAYFHIESEGVQSDLLADLVGERLAETGAAGTARGPGADRRPPRADHQSAPQGEGPALGRHPQTPPLRPGERRADLAAGPGLTAVCDSTARGAGTRPSRPRLWQAAGVVKVEMSTSRRPRRGPKVGHVFLPRSAVTVFVWPRSSSASMSTSVSGSPLASSSSSAPRRSPPTGG